MNNFTPAPWAITTSPSSDHTFTRTICGTNAALGLTPVCDVRRILPGEHQAEELANAALISAAPELLAALEDMLDLMGPLDDIANIRRKQVAKAAITKAKGIKS